MLHIILAGISVASSELSKVKSNASGWFLALLPLSLVGFFSFLLPRVVTGEIFAVSYPWIPSFNITLSFYLDGLSLIFALLISGIGTLIVIYAGGYLGNHPQLGRFYLYIFMFMASMLGVVLADNLITLFVFWELTSLSSYLLIGFNHRQQNSRDSALQALLVTGSGGLAMLAGLILLGLVGGSWELSALLTQGEFIRAQPLYPAIVVLVLLGAFTKSAQFPFHIWLPNAMAAPTPVSAYLHSATMVKAGVYLVARTSPILGGTVAWQFGLQFFGAVTMLLGAYIAWRQTDLKRILAYSTVSALGTLMLLLGIGTSSAVKAAIVFLVVHSLYKGALFMAAGAIDHETGTRDIRQLGGLFRLMPITFVAVALAALSMAGALPLFLGYIGKKLIYEATLHAASATMLLTGVTMLANILTIVAAGLVAYQPFLGRSQADPPKKAHEAPLSLWLGPALLGALGLALVVLVELVPKNLFKPLVGASATAIMAANELVSVKLTVWSGFNTIFFLSLVTVVAGVSFYVGRSFFQQITQPLNRVEAWGPERWYKLSLDGLKYVAAKQTALIQHGYLRYYILTIIGVTVGLVGFTLFGRQGLNGMVSWSGVRFHEAAIAALVLLATGAAITSSSRLKTVVALGAVGFGISVLFVQFGAPDLAMTQLATDTLTVILLLLVLYHLPPWSKLSNTGTRLRDAMIALATGGVVTLLILTVLTLPLESRLTPFFAENSLPLAKGRNIVNVILVDFRALDTLGEISVLAVAAMGVYALLKARNASK